MKLSLQSKLNLINILDKRRKMIEEENLHIDDRINYARFLELYEKYGESFDEKEFAKLFLDIPYLKHYYIQCGKTGPKGTPILTKEYVSDEELETIRNKVISENNFKTMDSVTYEQLLELYEKYGGRLSLKTFAEETLDITLHTVECLKSGSVKEAKVLKPSEISKSEIKRIKKIVLEQSGLHLEEQITLVQFEELYKKFGEGLSESVFANKILEIKNDRFNVLKRGDSKETTVFSNYIVNPQDIFKLREKVIIEENLHIDDLLTNERFKALYEKHGWILPELVFAEEILDINAVGVKNMRVAGTQAAILKNIFVPEEFLQELKEIVIKENKLANNQVFNLKQFEDFYKKYGSVLPRKLFATEVLGMTEDGFVCLDNEINETTHILVNDQPTDFEALRKLVIEQEHLHYNDKIEYSRFLEIYEKYGGNIPDRFFAEKVLDLTYSQLCALKNKKVKNYAYILKNEPLPSEEEIKKLKYKVIKENKLHRKDKINLKQFQELHIKYGGILPDYMFAEKILDIQTVELKEMLNHPEKNIEKMVLLQTTMSDEEVADLRENVIVDNILYTRKDMTREEFYKYYNKYNHILSEIEFAKKVLGVNKQSLNKLKSELVEKIKVLIDLEDGQKITQKEVISKNREKKELKEARQKEAFTKKIERIIDDYKYTPQNVGHVRQYIKSCKEDFENEKFPIERLDFLEECMTFVLCNSSEIELFSKICIHFRKYNKAKRFISENIENPGIKSKERQHLYELQGHIHYAIKKEKAVQFIMEKKYDAKTIAEKVGISETDVIKMKKRIFDEKVNSQEKKGKEHE